MSTYHIFYQTQYKRAWECFKTPTFDLTQEWGKFGGVGQTILDVQILLR